MRRLLLAATAACLPVFAQAAPLIGTGDTMNVTGNATFTANVVSFTSPATLAVGTGAYTALGTCSACVLVSTPLTFSPFTATPNLFSVSNNGLTATVSLTSQVLPPSIVGNTLAINDDATLTLTGFASTPGTVSLTINQATGAISGSFSATAQGIAIPEPGSIAILGIGLLGLWGARRWAR